MRSREAPAQQPTITCLRENLLDATDAPRAFIYPGFSLHEELALLVRSGLTSLEALRTATYNPAEYLDSLDFLGTIGQGNIADLVLLDADPLKDIHNTTRISAVIAMGGCSIRPHWAHC